MKKKSPPKINIGEKYGRWLVLDVERVGNYYRGICQCDCGNTGSIRQDTLLNGQSSSCGCYSKEVIRKISSKRGGVTTHPLYQRWYDMNRRCYDPTRKDFHHYGGRGITVCDAWNKCNPDGFINFIRDMEESYIEGLEIDRINNDGNYCKENCKWSTRSEQVINSRNIISNIGAVRWLNDGEETLHLAAMAKKHGLDPHLLQDRITKMGWTLEQAIKTPVKVKKYRIIYRDHFYQVGDIFVTNICNRSHKLGVSSGQLLRSVLSEDVTVEAYSGGIWVEVESNISVVDSSPYVLKDAHFVSIIRSEFLSKLKQVKASNYKSPYKGVWFDQKTGKFRARIKIGDTRVSLGYYNTEIEAAEAVREYLRGVINE